VQRNAMRSFAEQTDFKALLRADADVTRVLPTSDIERAFDLDEQLKHVDHVFGRVFGTNLNAEPAEHAESNNNLRAQRALRS
jgi:adenylosuccinate lyase